MGYSISVKLSQLATEFQATLFPKIQSPLSPKHSAPQGPQILSKNRGTREEKQLPTGLEQDPGKLVV